VSILGKSYARFGWILGHSRRDLRWPQVGALRTVVVESAIASTSYQSMGGGGEVVRISLSPSLNFPGQPVAFRFWKRPGRLGALRQTLGAACLLVLTAGIRSRQVTFYAYGGGRHCNMGDERYGALR
jgi:hypothetical protein